MAFEYWTDIAPEALESCASLLESDSRRKDPTFVIPPRRPTAWELRIAVSSSGHSGKLVGGLTGETYQSWLTISVIYVLDIVSRQGIGRRLMEMAEQIAVKRGCKYAMVDTMDFLAPDFFLKVGYRKVGEVPDWNSEGHARLLLTKQLGSD